MASDTPADVGPNRSPVPPEVDWPLALAEHRSWLCSVVLARVGDAHAVEDVLQEVALAAVRDGSRLREASKVAPWLYRVAVRQALIYRRQTGRRRKKHQELCRRAEAEADPASLDPLRWLLVRERHSLVRAALTSLDERDAEILLLKYAENWSYSQIAANLGVSVSAVESRLHRARRKLRQVLVNQVR